MENKHREYKRLVKDSKIAVLFVHGIMSGPNHFNYFTPLVPENMTMYNLLLDGHGAGIKEFGSTSMKKWVAQVSKAVEDLSASHDEIYMVGHSMGTLLSIEQALKNEKITRMFLLAVPIKVWLYKESFDYARLSAANKLDLESPRVIRKMESASVLLDKNLFKNVGAIPRFLELFAKIRYIRKNMHKLKTCANAYQSKYDELVSRKSPKILRNESSINVHVLENSDHAYYEANDLAFLKDEFIKFLN